MSGGVDSSVAAALLVEQGYDVVGIMLRLWSEGETPQAGMGMPAYGPIRSNRCCTPEDTNLARRVAEQLGIPFYLVNVADSFKRIVVDDFIAQYAAGRTPNPCFNCNRHMRFEILLNKALGLGAEKLATGHYARVAPSSPVPLPRLTTGEGDSFAGGKYQLLRGVDRNKDQSYVLSVLTQDKLRHVLFPLGELTKPQVRQIAAKKGLPVAEKPESQDLCFLAEGDYREFLRRNAPEAIRPGPIRDTSGRVLGQHHGLPFYTIGQRKGIGIAGPEALYVIALDVADNVLIVGTASELGRSECTALRVNYVSGETPTAPFRATAKIRYKAREANVTVTPICHPERSEGSLSATNEILRSAQNDKTDRHPERSEGSLSATSEILRSAQNDKTGRHPERSEGSLSGTSEILRSAQNDDDPMAHVRFDEPQRDITPGQGIVFYDGEVVIGGGIIA
jgi:tRNA-specific 2-thiouridylase